ncbi:hypothetical protein TNIN_157831 [Trichonephila inaurata madagascariensis]|uniref:Uncharacterized protein n=1 Tax=Trichonephila inaurata madagascariensis TaxID=2747483 RepID=A0A8X7CUS0_9ARAC|nr:hypothetical protein TNIN_157831 [Trichonephila inaurata madagascariensis]
MGVDAGTVRNKLCRDWKRKSPGAFPKGRPPVAILAPRADPFVGSSEDSRCSPVLIEALVKTEPECLVVANVAGASSPFGACCFAATEGCAGNMYKEVSMESRCGTSILLSQPGDGFLFQARTTEPRRCSERHFKHRS